MSFTDEFVVNRGSDLTFEFNWPNGEGGNANLTGFSIAVYDWHASLASRITLAIINAATGSSCQARVCKFLQCPDPQADPAS